MRKTLLFVFFFLLISLVSPAQQAKRVYITLDVSGSMSGDKYVLANYTTQMIVTLCDDDDDVYMIVYGKEKRLSKEANPLKPIQKPMDKIRFGIPLSTVSQFDDIQGFNRVYQPSEDKQDWLFIIGDGYWATEAEEYRRDREKFQNTVKSGTLNVCYLQTGMSVTEHSDFTGFVETLGVIDIGKSDIDPKTIMQECDHFAKKILGFSDIGMKMDKSGKQCLSIKAELPISEFILVYQDKVAPAELAKVNSVTADGHTLNVELKGTPTTIPVQDNVFTKLSGNVWRVKSPTTIPAGTKIEVCFDKNILLENVGVYPVVENVEFGNVGFTTLDNKLKQINSNTFSICRNENSAKVRVELTEASSQNLPVSLLKQTSVVVRANNKEYQAAYNNGGFECVIDLIDDETQYYAECDCPGYFKRITSLTTIVKGDCAPETPRETKVMDTIELPPMTFHALKERPIRGYLKEEGEGGGTLDPKKFDIKVEVENEFFYEEPRLSFDGDTISLYLTPKGGWCECFFPEDLNIRIISTPKEGAFDDEGKQFNETVHPLHLTVEKGRSWLSRCLWVLLTILGLLLFVFYLRALLRKRRFKKSARIKHTYMELRGGRYIETDLQQGIRLRERGFVAWVKRWLLPFPDEQRTPPMWLTPPAGSLTFVAAKSKESVDIKKKGFDKNKLRMDGYDPDNDDDDSSTIEMDTIRVYQQKKYAGRLEYDSGSKDDEKYYRIILGVLIMASIVVIITLLVFMAKSFL